MKNSKYIIWIYAAAIAVAISGFTYSGLKGNTWFKVKSTKSTSFYDSGPGIILHK